MAHGEGSVKISKPISDVFAFVADGTNNLKWRSSVLDVALSGGTSGMVGATYTQGLRGPGGKRIDGDYTITNYVPNSSLSFQVVAGPAHPVGTFTFREDAGDTRVNFVLDLKTKGLQKLMDPMITATMAREIEALGSLKRVLEAQP